MDDLISRQAAISIPLTPKGLRKYQTCNLDDAYDEGWGDYQACVSQLPSAQPLTAYIISDEDGNIKCSNCGSFECWGNYCMNCGARMDGEQE